MFRIKSMDNSQGKCGRYKVRLRLFAHWSDIIMVLSHVMNSQVRRRIEVATHDNSDGKSSRFKDLDIVRIQTLSSKFLGYAIVCIPPFLSPFSDLFRHEITMTSPMLSGIQCLCFLPLDPPHRCSTPYSNGSMLPPSTSIKLPPYNDPLPLPTMLINSALVLIPLSSSAIPLSLSLPRITRHPMSESIGLEAHHFPLLSECAQSICRQWPSGATVACLSRECCDVIVHASCGQPR